MTAATQTVPTEKWKKLNENQSYFRFFFRITVVGVLYHFLAEWFQIFSQREQ